MTHLPVSRDRDLQSSHQSKTARPASTARNRFMEAISSSDLPIVIAISLAGLLLMLNFMMQYPDVSAVIEQYNLF
jgi:hypothetical protein